MCFWKSKSLWDQNGNVWCRASSWRSKSKESSAQCIEICTRSNIFVESSQCAHNLKYLTCSYCDTAHCCFILWHALHLGFIYRVVCSAWGVQYEFMFVQSNVQCVQPILQYLVCTLQCKCRYCAVCALLLGCLVRVIGERKVASIFQPSQNRAYSDTLVSPDLFFWTRYFPHHLLEYWPNYGSIVASQLWQRTCKVKDIC